MSEIPEKISRFEILEVIGKGAMGVVYKARDPNIDRTVAIKVIRTAELEEAPEGAELIQRFRREVQTAGVLAHSNIITIYDVGQEGDLHWIAMEYVDGPSLAKIIDDRVVLPLQDVLAIFVKICSAVDFAHRRGIIHRDLKPANILMTEEWEPKIADFGIARVASSTMTRTGVILGTPSYMSPEQITGQQIDGRSDIFALGIILYELVTGERPFLGDNPTTIMYKIVHSTPLDPSTVNMALPSGLSDIVMKALAKKPQERYQTAGRMANDLISLVKSSPEFAFATSRLDMPTATISSGDISTAFDRYQSVEAPVTRRGRSAVLFIVLPLIVLVAVIAGGLYFISQGGFFGGDTNGGSTAGSGGGMVAPVLTKGISIASEPEGAIIFIDGERLEELTPATISVTKPQGTEIKILLEKECLAAEGTVRIEDPNAAEQTYTLETKHRELSVSSEPAGADVRLDGEVHGKTPATLDIVCGMEYQLRLDLAGYRSKTIALDWDSEPVMATLDPLAPGTLEFRGDYPVTVLSGGSTVARSVRSVNLNPGRYTLRLVNSEYYLSKDVSVEVKEGERRMIELPGLGSLWVFARPADAEIVIDGRNLGKVLPIRGLKIVAGSHSVGFRWENREKTISIEVVAGQEFRVQEVLDQ